ncbi:DUF4260 family protein [Lysinibacillus sp. NPDC097231]|uniref:DUF4260 family protein n=1 Tax=Lysinibacillus sp. NPDC097231 TaxID=3364142 RepID=UPI003813B87C
MKLRKIISLEYLIVFLLCVFFYWQISDIGFVTMSTPLLMASFMWLAHIFLDRALCYGLKYDKVFTKTQLQQIE